MPKRLNISSPVITSEARQSRAFVRGSGLPRRFAPRNDGRGLSVGSTPPSPPSGGEGRAASAAKGEGGRGVARMELMDISSRQFEHVSRSLRFALSPSPPAPLPLKGARGANGSETLTPVSAPILAQRDQDHSGDAFGVFENVAVGEADNFIASALHKGGTGGIIFLSSRVAVTVEFDNKLMTARREIGGIIGAEHHLADEFDAFKPAAAKDRPEFCFRRRHFGSKPFCAVPVRDVALGQFTPPSPFAAARLFPFPLKRAKEFGNHSHHA